MTDITGPVIGIGVGIILVIVVIIWFRRRSNYEY
jgi:flagellar biosynthesis/type III secretory pathway M-ring protein FliF/YscJ